MARTFTAAELMQRVRDMGDFHGARPSPATLLGYVSDSRAELHDMLADVDPSRFETTQAIATVGAASFNLPADYRSTIGVDYQDTSGIWRELEWIDERERNRFQSLGNALQTAEAFRLIQSTLVLYPTPPSGQTYRHLYVPIPAKLVADTDVIEGVSGWDEYIVVDAIIKCVLSEADPDMAPPWMARKAELKQRIEELRSARVMTQARRVFDARELDVLSNDPYPYGRRWL